MTSGPEERPRTAPPVGTDGRWADGHVIVCGLGGVGLRTVEQLHLSGVPVVVVDDDPDLRLARIVENWGVPQVHRSARLGVGLAEAGLDRASAVICVESNELATLEIAMRVREERPDIRLVVLLANPSVGRALERVTGRGSVLDVAALAAPSFVEACLRRTSHEIEIAGELFAVAQVPVERTRGNVPQPLRQPGPVAVMSERRGDGVLSGPGPPVVAGDRVAVLGTPVELERSGIAIGQSPGDRRRSVSLAAHGQAACQRLPAARARRASPWPCADSPLCCSSVSPSSTSPTSSPETTPTSTS